MPNQAAAEGAGTEGGCGPTVVSAPSAANPEISERPRRRTCTAPEKPRIPKAADIAVKAGDEIVPLPADAIEIARPVRCSDDIDHRRLAIPDAIEALVYRV